MKKISALLIFSICALIVFSRENNLFYRGWSKIHNKPEPIKGHEKDSLPWTSYKDVSYGNDEQQKMDVYLPLVRNSKTRMMIIIHGGGWYQGDKSEFDSFVDEFQKRLPGYAFANVNYRLVKKGGNYFPTQENDIKSAIEFLKNKSPEYNISTDYILLGQSAGAQLALLQGYKHSDIVQPKGIISFFGPVDLTFLYKNSDSAMSTFCKPL